MKISQSALQLGYQFQKSTGTAQQTERNVRILDNNGSRVETGPAGLTRNSASITNVQQQTLSDAVRINNQSLVTDLDSGEAQYFESAELLQSVSSILAEEEVTVNQVQILGQPGNNRGAVSVEVTSIAQFESDTNIQANALGTVTTEDGRQIDFLLELEYDRNIKTTQESTFVGERNLIDPLVINLEGGAPSLSDQYFEFDLNSDGNKQSLHQTAAGTGFLAFDKNENGVIDNGQELFGPNSNSGFGELAQYDDDDNGWIDENDAIFSQLSYMDFDENGEQRLRSISEVGLGALYLGSEQMDLDLFDSDGNFQANIARNGVALKETGQAVSLQEVHYSDQAVGKGEVQMEGAQTLNFAPSVINGVLITPAIAEGTVSIESSLTMFQFDDVVLNARNTETRVSLQQSEQQTLLTDNGIRLSANGIGIAASISEASTSVVVSQGTSNANTTTQVDIQRREEVQSIFQARFEAGFTVAPVQNVSSNTSNSGPRVDIPELTASVFWFDERQQYQSEYEGGSKLGQLKQLVADLKEIREQQKESQDKIGIYDQVGKF